MSAAPHQQPARHMFAQWLTCFLHDTPTERLAAGEACAAPAALGWRRPSMAVAASEGSSVAASRPARLAPGAAGRRPRCERAARGAACACAPNLCRVLVRRRARRVAPWRRAALLAETQRTASGRCLRCFVSTECDGEGMHERIASACSGSRRAMLAINGPHQQYLNRSD